MVARGDTVGSSQQGKGMATRERDASQGCLRGSVRHPDVTSTRTVVSMCQLTDHKGSSDPSDNPETGGPAVRTHEAARKRLFTVSTGEQIVSAWWTAPGYQWESDVDTSCTSPRQLEQTSFSSAR